MLLGAWVLMVTEVLGEGWIEKDRKDGQWGCKWPTRHSALDDQT